MKLTFIIRFLLVCFFFFASFSNSQGQTQDFASINWKFVPDLGNIGGANFIEYDFNKDGDLELIYPSSRWRGVLKVLDYKDGAYTEIFSSNILSDGIDWVALYDLDGDGVSHLYVAYEGRTIEKFDLETLSPVETISLNIDRDLDKFYFVDVEEDGVFEILVAAFHSVYLLDATGNPIYHREVYRLEDLVVGDVDGDEELEVVASGQDDSFVWNLNNFEDEWMFEDTFGKALLLYRAEGTDRELIYTMKGNYFVQCFDAKSQKMLWEMEEDWEVTKIEIVDIDGDGTFELLVGMNWESDGIRCYDLDSRDLLWEMDILNRGIADFSVIDLNGDGNSEIAYGCGHKSSSEDLLVVFDPVSQENLWNGIALAEEFSFDLDDYNGDGVEDYFFASKSSNTLYGGGLAFLYDGATKKEQFRIEPVGFSGEDIMDVSLLAHNATTYLTIVYEERVKIYNYEKNSLIVNEYFSNDDFEMGGMKILEGMDHPQLFLFTDEGKLHIYDFIDNALVKVRSIFGSGNEVYDYQIGNFDTDQQQELAVLRNGVISIFEGDNYYPGQDISLQSIAPKAFTIADINRDGVKDVLFYAGNSQMGVINYQDTEKIAYYPIESSSVRAIITANLNQDADIEIIVLSNEKLYIYDNEWNLLYNPEYWITSAYSDRVKKLEVRDTDANQHMEIIVGTEYGVFQFEVAEAYRDISLPIVKNYLPVSYNTSLATNTILEVFFSKDIDEATVNDNIEIVDESGTSLSFQTSYTASEYKLTITPTTTWSSNDKITVTLQNQLSDTVGNPLDGNYNGVANGETDDFSWFFLTGASTDNEGPVVEVSSIPYEIYRGMPLELQGHASDTGEAVSSNISRIEYFIDEPVVQGNGTLIQADDSQFDEIFESFSQRIATRNLDFGSHSIYLIAQDYLGNWGKTLQLDFIIRAENPANWTGYGNNILQTSSNPHAKLQGPLRVNYRIKNSYPLTKSISVDNYLIYGVKYGDLQQLNCRNIHTGEVIWQNEYEIEEYISPPAYAYGAVYVQLGEGYNSRLLCLDVHTGEQIWQSSTYNGGDNQTYGPLIYEDKVYIEREGAVNFAAYNAFTGEFLWSQKIGHNYLWQPVVYQDTLYIYSKDLYAINPHSGGIYYKIDRTKIPHSDEFGKLGRNIVVDAANQQLILTSWKHMHAWSLTDQKINWSLPYSDYSTPALDDGKLYFTSYGNLNEYDVRTGELLWRHELGYYIKIESPPVVNSNLIVYDVSSNLYIFDRQTHELLLTYNRGGNFILSEDYLIVSTNSSDGLMVIGQGEPESPLQGYLEIAQPILCNGRYEGRIVSEITGGTGFYTYDWNTTSGGGGANIGGVKAGTYRLTVTDLNDEELKLNIELTEPSKLFVDYAQIPETDNNMDGKGQLIVAGGTPPYSYEWQDFPDNDTHIIDNVEAGEYTVEVTDSNDCRDYAYVRIDKVTDISSPHLSSDIKVYPTLTNDFVKIESEKIWEDMSIQVFDSRGKELSSNQYKKWKSSNISLQGHNAGIYVIHVGNQDFKTIHKVLLMSE